LKKSTVRWALKQWELVERLIYERQQYERIAAKMEAALSTPPKFTMVPIDDAGAAHPDDEDRAYLVWLDARTAEFRCTIHALATTYTVVAVDLYKDGECILRSPLQKPVAVMTGLDLSMTHTITMQDEAHPFGGAFMRSLFS
jgi:hypothetical protein